MRFVLMKKVLLVITFQKKIYNYPKIRKKCKNGRYLKIIGSTGNNLKNVDLQIPLGAFSCVTGSRRVVNLH